MINQTFKRDPASGAIVFERTPIEIRLDELEKRLSETIAKLEQLIRRTANGTSSNAD